MPLFRSLRARVLFWVSVALVVLFALTIAGLDLAFRQSTERALEELLEAQLLGLIALAEPDRGGGLALPGEALDSRFNVADSGLYGILWDGAGRVLWRSPSWVGREPRVERLPAPGESRYALLELPGLPPLQALLMGITWEFADGHAVPYTFGIAASLEPYQARQGAFRRNLIGWFAGITATMLAVLTGLLGWVLRPLRRLERQVREVEAGGRSALTGLYPSELVGLANNLNALIDTERRRLVRYRHMLDDLAHSLKTPLAAMRSLLSERNPAADQSAVLERELDRMDQRVSYQLRRARASGATGLGVEPVPVGPLILDLKETLDKVYRAKAVHCTTDVADGVCFHGDRGDLTEVLGNLLENAYKFCAHRVAIAAAAGERLIVTVADDGPGIDSKQIDFILERGVRADESVPGHGIGLAVVRETAALYGGGVRFGRSRWGGAEVAVELGRAGATS